MIIFSVPLADPTDPGGWGYWLNANHLEHLQFNQIAQANNHGAQLPFFDLGWWKGDSDSIDQWMSNHEAMTMAITGITGVGNPDFGEADWQNPHSYMVWMDLHGLWHAQQRAKFGIK